MGPVDKNNYKTKTWLQNLCVCCVCVWLKFLNSVYLSVLSVSFNLMAVMFNAFHKTYKEKYIQRFGN